MKKYTVYYDQRLEIEVEANNEEIAKDLAKELILDEVSIKGDQVKNDGLEFGDIEEERIDPDEHDDVIDSMAMMLLRMNRKPLGVIK